MLKVIMTLLKLSVFAAIVLVLANYIKWNGKTVSDQVKTQLSHAERSIGKIPHWGGKVKEELRETKRRRPSASSREGSLNGLQNLSENRDTDTSDGSDITPSERQKLRALIRELNQSHFRD